MGFSSKPNNRLAALGLLIGALLQSQALNAQEWELIQPETSSIPGQRVGNPLLRSKPIRSLQWTIVSPTQPITAEAGRPPQPIGTTDSVTAQTNEPNWKQLSTEEIIQQQQEIEQEIETAQELINNPPITYPVSGPTYANFRALWRDGDWLPQISNTVPVGFGPQGVMTTFEFRGIDCITGAGLCTVPADWQDYKNQISRKGDAFYDFSLGFGDSTKYIGVVLTAIIEGTEVPIGDRQNSSNGLFADKNLGIHITRNLGPDTGIRLGVDNLFREVCDDGFCGLPQSAYGVVSQRLRLNPDQDAWFANAYLTAGAGNGSFRSLGNQIQASYLAQRAAGCSTYGYQPKNDCNATTRRKAVFAAYDYGDIFPIASLGVEVVKGFNLITEWSGRNLNAGLSFRPFPELGLVITPMFENLVNNCDYGCRVSVPDYPEGAPLPSNVLTERPRFSIQASIEVKF